MDADALVSDLIDLDVVDEAKVETSEHHSPWVRFEIPDGRIAPEVSRVLADHDATLFEGCLTNGYHEFRARGPY